MDYFLINLIINNINKVSSGYIIIDMFISIIVLICSTILFNEKYKNILITIINNYLYQKDKINRLTFKSSDKDVSSKYKAIMHFINENNDPSVKSLIETELKKYNHRKEDDEVESSVYRVIQNNKFVVSKNIWGRVFSTEKDRTEFNGKTSWIEYQNLEISSDVHTTKYLIEWVDKIERDYKNFIKTKLLEGQSLIEVTWNTYDDIIECFYTRWESNVTFDNRFFTGKDDIISKIKFFLNNEQWYKDRGIPYTLGILLWGEPGCGKTGFIKALMNLTGRHGIDIKLSNSFNFTRLREIICDEQITHDIIIPQNKRILLFEDIDAMGDIVKDRDLPKEKNQTKELEDTIKEIMNKKNKKNKKGFDDFGPNDYSNQNNNLSYFLNILDGLNECPGRIIIMTTNKPEYLDAALVRPGRIDFKINMSKATVYDIKNILEHYWNVSIEKDIPNNWEKKLSHAEIVSYCRMSNNIEDSFFKINKYISSEYEKIISESPVPGASGTSPDKDNFVSSSIDCLPSEDSTQFRIINENYYSENIKLQPMKEIVL